jgi:hypothetical protein
MIHLENVLDLFGEMTQGVSEDVPVEGEARKMMIQGGISINGKKLSDQYTSFFNYFRILVGPKG